MKTIGPAFLILFAALMATAGTGISLVAFPWLALQHHGSARDASVVAAAMTVPLVLSTLVAGAAVDFFGRRRVSLVSDSLSGTAVAAVPLIVGGILELPIGIASGAGQRRRRFILLGGLVFTGSVLAVGFAESFAVLLIALTIFFPASGAFVSLTQSALMDSAPERQAQHMARWRLAGSAGAAGGVAGGMDFGTGLRSRQRAGAGHRFLPRGFLGCVVAAAQCAAKR